MAVNKVMLENFRSKEIPIYVMLDTILDESVILLNCIMDNFILFMNSMLLAVAFRAGSAIT